ncbi:hypothetical protein AM440_04585 [Escherichia coli]|nr:hypothetical protein AM440_04585 [Escherichia coli]
MNKLESLPAFEWQDHDEGDSDKFHYAGVGVNYSF